MCLRSCSFSKLQRYLGYVIILQVFLFVSVNFSIHDTLTNDQSTQNDTNVNESESILTVKNEHADNKQRTRRKEPSSTNGKDAQQPLDDEQQRPNRFPIEPLLERDCQLRSDEMMLCYSSSSMTSYRERSSSTTAATATTPTMTSALEIDIAKRLLEHRYRCSASTLVVRNSDSREDDDPRPCLWIQPIYLQQQEQQWEEEESSWSSSLSFRPRPIDKVWSSDYSSPPASSVEVFEAAVHPYLMTLELFPQYFWLPTPLWNKKRKRLVCLINNATLDNPLGGGRARATVRKQIQMRSLTSSTNHVDSEHWSVWLEQLRQCDEIVSNSVEPIVLADSLEAPSQYVGGVVEEGEVFVKNEFHHNGSGESSIITDTSGLYRRYLKQTERTISNHRQLTRDDIERFSQTTARTFPYDLFEPMGKKNDAKTIAAETSSLALQQQEQDLKTLVILMGNLRGGETSWKTLYQHVLDINWADLALVIGEVPAENKTSSLFQRAKYVYEFPEWNDWADAIDLILVEYEQQQHVNNNNNNHNSNRNEWRSKILKHASKEWGTWGAAGDKPGSGAVIFVARWYVQKFLLEYNLLDQYDRFVVTRSDHYYGCDHDLSRLDNDYVWVPMGEDYKDGITDRYVLANRATILRALNIYPEIVGHPDKFYSPDFSSINPEQLVKLRWQHESIWPWVRRFERVMFTCAVPGDTTRWSLPANTTVKEGVLVKYPFEYEETTCVCKTGPCDFVFTRRKLKLGYPIRGKSTSRKRKEP